jgi:hypothetical protein
MRPRPLLALLLAACAAPPIEPAPAQPEPAAAPPRLTGSVRATDDGLHHADVPLPPDRARHLRVDGDTLYFFDRARPQLRALDLTAPTASRPVLELPPLEHPAFASPDPLAYLQRQEDLDLTAGVLCIDLHDRPDQPTTTYNLRIDLATATLERRLVEDLAGDQCGVLREAVRPRLCTPAGPSAATTVDGTRVDL